MHHGAVDKSSSNNRSVLQAASAFLMLKIGPIRLALVGITAGHQSSRSADEKVIVLEISKSYNSTPDVSPGFLNQFFLTLVRLYQYIYSQFLGIVLFKVIFWAHFLGSHSFP